MLLCVLTMLAETCAFFFTLFQQHNVAFILHVSNLLLLYRFLLHLFFFFSYARFSVGCAALATLTSNIDASLMITSTFPWLLIYPQKAPLFSFIS